MSIPRIRRQMEQVTTGRTKQFFIVISCMLEEISSPFYDNIITSKRVDIAFFLPQGILWE